MKPNYYLMLDALTLAALWYLFIPPPALAYFDLGVGTYLVQLIFGFGAAIWLSMMARLRRKKTAFFAKDEKAPTDKLEPGDNLAANKQEPSSENESTIAKTISNASPLTSSESDKTSPVEATVTSGSDAVSSGNNDRTAS